MAEAPVVSQVSDPAAFPSRHDASTSLHGVARVLARQWRTAAAILGSLLLACLLYCLIVPNQYEARARLALRTAPATALNLDPADSSYSGSLASGQVQLETLANVFRSDQLAWRVILSAKLYDQPAFAGDFARRFPGFRPAAPDPDAQAWLLERFQERLHVRTLPRTLVVEIRFRSRSAALSTAVVSELIRQFNEQDAESRILATAQAAGWMQQQLQDLKLRSDRAEQNLLAFQRQHDLLVSPETLSNGQPGAVQHVSAFAQVDDLSRELVAASAERILREVQYRAALQSDPELVLASDPRLQDESGNPAAAQLRQLRARQSELEQEQTQLRLEHGPNFPRVQEISAQLQDIARQLQAQDARLRDQFKSAWQGAADREEMLRQKLAEQTRAGQGVNGDLLQYETMRRQADASRELYIHMQERVEEARLDAPAHSSQLWIVDAPRAPSRPVTPDLPLYLAITAFVGIWLALGGTLWMESIRPSVPRVGILVVAALLGFNTGFAQAPTPSTSGLPTGVAKIPGRQDLKAPANANEAPRVWTGSGAPGPAAPALDLNLTGVLPAPIAPGDLLDISEFHTPEFHASARVSAAGTVDLPLIGAISVNGLDEQSAAKAIASALIAKGMLLHPQVFVLVTSYMGQDVSVLGEVARPGVYPYGVHHRLLDLISEASGLTPAAGSLVSVAHRSAPQNPQVIALAEDSTAMNPEHNPELLPGDTIRVSRAGLVYVVGDVLRPGGFALEPAQSMTVLRALSLAWGPSMNASLKHAVLLREQQGGRTVTTLNLKRMLRGQDPDIPIHEHDILYVPDSAAKNLWNRTMESVVQSTAGVSIYSAMVYSQRY